MLITLVDPSLFTFPYDRALALGLARGGHTVSLHGRRLRPGEGAADDVSLREDFYKLAGSRPVSALPAPLRLGIKGLDHVWSMTRLLSGLRRDRPDVIHFQWLPLPMVDSLLLDRFRRVATLVATVHDTEPFNGDPSAKLQVKGFRRCLAAFDRLLVHTAQGKERLERLGLPAERVAQIAMGPSHEPVPCPDDPMDGPLTFMLFGKIKPYKGADLLIEAFAAMPDPLRSQCRVRIVGQPYIDLAPLHQLAASKGVDVSIEPGFVSDADLPALFGPGTVAVFPYREIEASAVMFQALAYGRPMIASRLGSFAELLHDGEHGHLVPPGDVAALSAALSHMAADRHFAARCAAQVRTLASEIPTWDDIAADTVENYRTAEASRS